MTPGEIASQPVRLEALLRHLPAALLVLGLSACAPHRPPFVEPDWGDAPSPYPSEITEVTREYRHCAEHCSFDRMVFRRDGTVIRRYLTGGHLDSLLSARIDSLAFVELVISLDKAGLFRPMAGAGEHVPLAVDSYIVSAASLCRRAVTTYSPLASDWYLGSEAVLAVERAASGLHWVRCCRPELQLSTHGSSRN
jgi:hypothetical protein